jgi:hypothetical protein
MTPAVTPAVAARAWRDRANVDAIIELVED